MNIPNSVGQDQEVSKKLLTELGYGPFGVLRPSFLAVKFTYAFLALFFALNLLYLLTGQSPDKKYREELKTYVMGSSSGKAFLKRHNSLLDFLRSNGTLAEEALFMDLVYPAMSSVKAYDNSLFRDLNAVPESYTDSSFTRFYLGAFFIWLQLVFLAVASWRFWILGALAGAFYGFYRFKLHDGKDLLGVMSNGSVFHSGMWVGLDNLTENGEPDLVAPGLACPRYVDDKEIDDSPFGPLLEQYEADCKTARRLVGYILAEKKFPAWVSPRGVKPVIEQTYANVPLYKHAYFVLEKALLLQALYRARVAEGGTLSGELEMPVDRVPGPDHEISINDYADYLACCFHRSLTPRLRLALAEIDPRELASIILSSQAGFLLTYDKEVGETWSVVSCFPELNARAMLQSVPDYAEEFSFYRRQLMRRALVYSARSSLFELNRLPMDMPDQTVAARQLVDLIFTPPHLLSRVAPEVELYALSKEVHATWKEKFIDLLGSPEGNVFKADCFIGPGEVLFAPLPKLLETFRQVVPEKSLTQLRELSERASLYREELKQSGEDIPPHLNHLLEPSEDDFVESLAKDHEVSEQDVLDWLGLRYVLRSYSWIAQRIGDKANGKAQMIFLIRERQKVFKTSNEDEPIKRISEFSGGAGVVPLRTTQVGEVLGEGWYKGMGEPKRIHVPLNRADYDKLLGSGTPKKPNKHKDDFISKKDEARGNVRRVALRAL